MCEHLSCAIVFLHNISSIHIHRKIDFVCCSVLQWIGILATLQVI